jgi:hypothetical protein
MKLYYEEILDNGDKSIVKLQKRMERAMEQLCNDHYSTFCKHLHVCDLAFGPSFFKEIQTHYDMTPSLGNILNQLSCLKYLN